MTGSYTIRSIITFDDENEKHHFIIMQVTYEDHLYLVSPFSGFIK
jgi:hypothetical protein